MTVGFAKSRRKPRPKKALTRQPRRVLSKDVIVVAALELIDRAGIESFSVRNVAKKLHVFPTAIYWHVGDRNKLLGDVLALVLRDLSSAEDAATWQDWIRALFIRYREIIRKHPNVALLIGVQLVANANVDFALIETILTRLEQAGFAGAKLVAAYNVVLGGMVGFTTHEFARVPDDNTAAWRSLVRRNIAALDSRHFPRIARHLPALTNKAFILRWQNGVDVPLDDGFAMFTEALILGLEAIAHQKVRSRR